MKEIKLSIIVPVYNVEKYLLEFINSIKYQLSEDVEIIFVNDGSTDNSLKILYENLEINENCIVVCKNNGGLSSARNEGLKLCRGKYVTFVDSDDYVNNNYIEILLKNLGNDLLMFDYTRLEASKKENLFLDIDEGTYNKTSINKIFIPNLFGVESLPFKNIISPMVWNKVYKLSIIRKNGLKFKSEREINSEDSLFNVEYLEKCNKLLYIKVPLLNYRLNHDSLTNKRKSKSFFVARDKLLKIYKTYSEKYDSPLFQRYKARIIFENIQWFQFCMLQDGSYRNNKKTYMDMYYGSFLEQESKILLEDKNVLCNVSNAYKIYFCLLSHGLFLFCYFIQYIKNKLHKDGIENS